MIIIDPGYDGAKIYDGNSLVAISNKNPGNVNMVCEGIISLYRIPKDQEFGVISAGVGIAYSDYFKSQGYNVKDMKIQSIK